MRKHPTIASRGKRWSASRRFHGWLATWLQDRRRSRAFSPVESNLLTGLVQFYQPQASATHLRSWDEDASVPSDPFLGFTGLVLDAISGSYLAGDYVQYQVFPFGTRDGARLYAGVAWMTEIWCSDDNDAVYWEAWFANPTWVTGYAVLRYVNGSLAGHRIVTAAAMFAGWTDDNDGWVEGLPCGYYDPPNTAKVVWNITSLFSSPPAITTAPSLFGGVAFDSTYGDRLVRVMSDDLRRAPDATLAYWVSPTVETGYNVLHSVRGSATGSFGGNYSVGTEFSVAGVAGSAIATGHVEGDWYLLVMRNDSLGGDHHIDLIRERDGAHFTHSESLTATPLSDADDFLLEGVWGVLVFANSWHYEVPGYALYDRMGIWDRALTNEEVLDLFNNGLGWTPA